LYDFAPLSHIKVKFFLLNLDVLIGVNIGRNKNTTTAVEQDYTLGIEQFGCLADYLVINVSSPNTPGLRALQSENELKNLLSSIRTVCNKISCQNEQDQTKRKPLIFLKVAPDLDENEIKSISYIIRQPNTQIDGLIISNTTIERMNTLKNEHRNETGGLSGRPLKEKALKTLRLFRHYTHGFFFVILLF
jgi:dihydroorotate dehydrogenase